MARTARRRAGTTRAPASAAPARAAESAGPRASDGELSQMATPVDDQVSRVGPTLHALRRAKGLSLQQLAAVSDVSAAAIHKIERNGMVPTITTLLKLGAALGVPVNYFVDEESPPPEPVHYTPAGAHRRVYTPHQGLELDGITGPYRQFQAAAALATVIPGASSGDKLLEHPGEELIHVTDGELTFVVGQHPYRLGPGDSLHFSGDVPHQWSNPGEVAAKAIWVALRNV